MQKGVLSPLHLHWTAPCGQQGTHWLWPSLQTCSEEILRGQNLNCEYFFSFSSQLSSPPVLSVCKAIFHADPIEKCLCAGDDLWLATQCFLHQSCWEFLSIALTTRKLWKFGVFVFVVVLACGFFVCFFFFLVKCCCCGISCIQSFKVYHSWWNG